MVRIAYFVHGKIAVGNATAESFLWATVGLPQNMDHWTIPVPSHARQLEPRFTSPLRVVASAMTSGPLSAEEAEALRQMQEEAGGRTGDASSYIELPIPSYYHTVDGCEILHQLMIYPNLSH